MLLGLAYYLTVLEPPRPDIEPWLSKPFTGWEFVIAATPFILYVTVAILLWKFAGGIAKRIWQDEDETSIPIVLDSYAVHAITFSAIGVLLILQALPVFIHFVLDTFTSLREPYYYSSFLQEKSDYFISIVQMLFGLGLIYGRKGILKSIHRVRDIKNLGRDPAFPAE